MDNKPQGVAKETDPKAHLEAIAGRKIDLPVGPLVLPANLFYLLGAYIGTTGGLDFPSSNITWKNLLFDQATQTSSAPLLDVSGVCSTDSNGKSVFRLTTFVGVEIDPAEPINIVATPRGSAPVFLTAEHAIVTVTVGGISKDIEITVYAWDSNGNPAPNVGFDWRCRFVSNTAG